MKELSIEEKAKAYDEAINRMKHYVVDEYGCSRIKVADVFPDLEESENIRIIKAIKYGLDHVFTNNTTIFEVTKEQCLAWLEKQGEPQIRTGIEWVDTIDDACDKRYSEEYAHGEYCHEQSFKCGFQEGIDWLEKQGEQSNWKPSKEEMDVLYGLAYITNQYDEHKEEVITRLYQDLKREFFNGSSYENMFPNTEDGVRRRSTIQVLEYARSLDNYNQYGKEDIDKNIAWLEKQGEQKPADKVESKFKVGDKIRRKTPSSCDKDMQVARIEKDYYICNHIGKFSSEVVPFSKQSSYELIEQNPAETEKGAKGNDREIPNSAWSEEDEVGLANAMWAIEQARTIAKDENDMGNLWYAERWLKSFRPKNRWKPSDKQIEALDFAADCIVPAEFCIKRKILKELLEQLKKLKE